MEFSVKVRVSHWEKDFSRFNFDSKPFLVFIEELPNQNASKSIRNFCDRTFALEFNEWTPIQESIRTYHDASTSHTSNSTGYYPAEQTSFGLFDQTNHGESSLSWGFQLWNSKSTLPALLGCDRSYRIKRSQQCEVYIVNLTLLTQIRSLLVCLLVFALFQLDTFCLQLKKTFWKERFRRALQID